MPQKIIELDPNSKKGKLIKILLHLDADYARFAKKVVKQATDMILDDLDDKVLTINKQRVSETFVIFKRALKSKIS